jgi:hypothetical protein
MEGDPAPFMIRHPGPAVVCPTPAAVGIRTPVMSDLPGYPDITMWGIVDPDAIGGKVFIEVVIIHLRGIIFIIPLIGPFLAGRTRRRRSLFSLIRNVDDAARKEKETQKDGQDIFFHGFFPPRNLLANIVPTIFSLSNLKRQRIFSYYVPKKGHLQPK